MFAPGIGFCGSGHPRNRRNGSKGSVISAMGCNHKKKKKKKTNKNVRGGLARNELSWKIILIVSWY